MRILGIDYGTKKVGLAVTDEAGKMAFPHSVIPNDTNLMKTVVALIESEQVQEIVIGHSLNLDGRPNDVQAQIESFITDLTLELPIPIHLEPEHFTSKQASAITGKTDQTDAAAAALIVEGYLSRTSISASAEEKVEKSSLKKPAEIDSEIITFDDFMSVEIKIGTIVAVEIVPDADKLLKLSVDLGEESLRQIVSGIREFFPDEQVLVGKQSPFVANLAPRTIRGLESQGMILAVGDNSFTLLEPSETVEPGSRAR